MGDLFEGFRWKEVLAVVGAFLTLAGFMMTIWISEVRDVRKRVRTLEIQMTAQKCLNSPELCRAIRRGE